MLPVFEESISSVARCHSGTAVLAFLEVKCVHARARRVESKGGVARSAKQSFTCASFPHGDLFVNNVCFLVCHFPVAVENVIISHCLFFIFFFYLEPLVPYPSSGIW